MNEFVNSINHCEVCQNKKLVSVLNLKDHPLCDDLIPIGDDKLSQTYPIEILFCDQCCTAHQRYQVPKVTLFPASYHYRARFTNDVLNGMRNLVTACEEKFGELTNKKILDIGCNDGSLLNFFKEKNAITFGIEPTDAYLDAKNGGHQIIGDFFTETMAEKFVRLHGQPDLITFTNVFAHIENLSDVLNGLKILMAPRTLLVIENHYLGSVLKHHQFDTFYHEHPRTYSVTSFDHIARVLGLALLEVDFPHRYGGNVRVFMGSQDLKPWSTSQIAELKNKEKQFGQSLADLQIKMERWQQNKKKQLLPLIDRYGKIRAKAFPGRAAILIKLLSLDETHISAVYEKPGSLKIGHYVPGTRIPIYSDDELFKQKESSEPLLNLAWHIPDEIQAYLDQHRYETEVLHILKPADFAD